MNLAAFILGLIRGFLRRVPLRHVFRRDFNWSFFLQTMRLRLRSVFRKKFRLTALLIFSVLVGAIRTYPWLKETLGEASWFTLVAVIQYAAMLIFLFRNRKKPGMTALMIGTFLNGLVIVVNGGMMPVGPYVTTFGPAVLERISEVPHYFLASGGEPLLFLGDLIPFWSFGWFMISLGDIPIMIGIFRLAAYLPRRIVRPRPKAVD